MRVFLGEAFRCLSAAFWSRFFTDGGLGSSFLGFYSFFLDSSFFGASFLTLALRAEVRLRVRLAFFSRTGLAFSREVLALESLGAGFSYFLAGDLGAGFSVSDFLAEAFFCSFFCFCGCWH